MFLLGSITLRKFGVIKQFSALSQPSLSVSRERADRPCRPPRTSETYRAKPQGYFEVSGVLDKTQLRFFTERSIRGMLEALGIEILVLKGINRTDKRKVRLVRFISMGWLSDIIFVQFGCQVRPRS